MHYKDSFTCVWVCLFVCLLVCVCDNVTTTLQSIDVLMMQTEKSFHTVSGYSLNNHIA
jgi:hypothetical protein